MRWIDRISLLMAIVAGLILVGLVAVTFYDVIMRYFLSAPMRGRQDIVEMGMVLSILLASLYTWRIGGHISVDLYEILITPTLERVRALLINLSVAGVFGLIAWTAWHGAEGAALFNEATNMIAISHRPFMLVIMVVSTMHALLIVAECLFGAKSVNKV